MLRLLPAACVGLLIGLPAFGYPLDRLGQEALGPHRGALVALTPQGRILGLINPKVAGSTNHPGSMAKLLTAATALEKGLGNCIFTCQGKECWQAHGKMDLKNALAHSCSSYFYQLGTVVGNPAIADEARQAGFGKRTGLLSQEAPGGIDAHQRLACGEAGFTSSPLQWAHFAAKLSRQRGLNWKQETYSTLQKGMMMAVDLGNAHQAAIPGVAIAGKSGTYMVNGKQYGWFMGYAPVGNPKIALCVYLENASGFKDAAQVARKAILAYFNRGTL